MLPERPGGIPGFPTSCCKSAQRELNPHFRHGKAAGCRYIIGAIYVGRIVKDQEHRVGVKPTLPRYECGVLATGRPVHVLQWDQRDLNPRAPCEAWSGGLRVRCAAANTLIPCCLRKSARKSRTFDLTLIRGPLSPLSHAAAFSRAGGTRTLA